jgi:hypothetical protein
VLADGLRDFVRAAHGHLGIDFKVEGQRDIAGPFFGHSIAVS